jgi:hypothetical protein
MADKTNPEMNQHPRVIRLGELELATLSGFKPRQSADVFKDTPKAIVKNSPGPRKRRAAYIWDC